MKIKNIIVLIAISLSMSFAGDYVFVVNSAADNSSLTKDEVKKVFFGKIVKWDNGTSIELTFNTEGNAKDAFLQPYLQASKKKFKKFWMKRVFAGFGPPPTEKTSSAGIVDYVNKTTGAIGFVEKSVAEKSGLKILTIK
jgi:ABC-type phosphate transport system substrate-binding protein